MADGVRTGVRDADRYVLFDLGTDSLLEPVSSPPGRFRVADYDPARLSESHRPGRHQYLLCREAFESDLVLSLPKLKLHRKAGLTGALKNLVGLNGNKDFLPHHRLGGSRGHGDCYPGWSVRKRVAEAFLDMANRRIGRPAYGTCLAAAAVLARLTLSEEGRALEGDWHGNDTCWRMVLDLNRILLYGRPDGTLADVPQRRILSLTDALVCGEGDGPLKPSPIQVGAVTFASSCPAADRVHAVLLGLDPDRIPLVRESTGRFRWPLGSPSSLRPDVVVGGRRRSLSEVAAEYGVCARPPRHWRGHVERGACRAGTSVSEGGG
jgi:hypothetical protein